MTFKTFTLDNGLQALAISDPRFVKSSAALAVMAGSMQNPKDHMGLAHFLEHMLFLGTKDFPKVGDYEDFLNKNGGGHNAYTSIDHTNYFFDCTHSAFEGALQRFSRFFVNPTFDEKYVEREKNAVHSEHEKNLKDDHRREYRFLQMITDPSHPFSMFATGDRETLAQADRDVVMDFYQNHYSANLMRLVLMSPLSGEELKKIATVYFSDIVNKELEVPQFSDSLFVHGD
jgi:secreted Zn-dependent insulinase-like peptidase